MPLTFITGPVRSGKSRFAERLAAATGRPVLYIATARADPADAEWTARIAHHRARRPAAWALLESAAEGAPELAAFVRAAPPERTLLLDSLGTWLAAQIDERTEYGALEGRATELAEALAASPADVIVVGEEVGWGVVPLAASARAFRDIAGRTQQRLARRAERAFLVVAGFAIDLAATGTTVEDDPYLG